MARSADATEVLHTAAMVYLSLAVTRAGRWARGAQSVVAPVESPMMPTRMGDMLVLAKVYVQAVTLRGDFKSDKDLRYLKSGLVNLSGQAPIIFRRDCINNHRIRNPST